MSIGEFQFINLSRLPSGPMRRTSREVRPGVNGGTLWDSGVRSEPIQVVSVVDVATISDAVDLVRQYEAAVGETPLPIKFAGDGLNGLLVVPVDVQPLEQGVHATVIGCGGTVGGNSNALCRAVWTLQPIHPAKETNEDQSS
jgi:hypothetical protein